MREKRFNALAALAAVFALAASLLLAGWKGADRSADAVMGYEQRLFDTARVHTIDIVMDDWDSFIENCEDEQYAACGVVIDGESYKTVAIRAKGNTSLASVSRMDSDRYSFKLEFDHYDDGGSYYGLDKLSLNNLIQDNTMLKDYLVYRMMNDFGADAPACSFAFITVNGEDWGLYLAVEGVEDSFLSRCYGGGETDLYKPDSTELGGGPGNGRNFDMDGLARTDAGQAEAGPQPEGMPQPPTGQTEGDAQPPGISQPNGMDGQTQTPGGFDGMGSADVLLQYTDDDPASYPNIFENAKTDVSDKDAARLISALKALSEGSVEECLDVDEILRYFVVHNYVVNGDSYTGSMIHNYYLAEQDGKLSMIPWDYNLAFGGFQSSDAASVVNDPIDTPLSVTGDGSRPMADWIFRDERYSALYHQYFAEFLDTVDVQGLIDEAYALIAPYVEQDPTKFCTYEEFTQGVETLREFCRLRSLSVAGQLEGSIPATDQGQQAEPDALVDASGLTIADMGSMQNTMGVQMGGFMGIRDRLTQTPDSTIPPGADRNQTPSDAAPETGETRAETGGVLNAPALLVGSVLALALGLLFAFRFKR